MSLRRATLLRLRTLALTGRRSLARRTPSPTPAMTLSTGSPTVSRTSRCRRMSPARPTPRMQPALPTGDSATSSASTSTTTRRTVEPADMPAPQTKRAYGAAAKRSASAARRAAAIAAATWTSTTQAAACVTCLARAVRDVKPGSASCPARSVRMHAAPSASPRISTPATVAVVTTPATTAEPASAETADARAG